MTVLADYPNFPGADGDPWPTAFNPSVTTTGLADILASGLRASTGNVGGQTDFVRGILDNAAVNGVADIGVKGQFDFSASATQPDCSMRFHLRSSNDWSGGGGARPATSVRLKWDSTGFVALEHTLSNGTLVTDDTVNVTMNIGHSKLFRFECEGNVVRAKVWDSFDGEPFTGGDDNDGFTLKAAMSTDIVSAGGRFQMILLGPTAAGASNGYARVRNLQFYDFGTPAPGTPVTPTFKVPTRKARGRRR